VLKLNRHHRQSTAIRVSRALFGAVLLLAVLWANIPSASLASSPVCNLACCAGRAPHAAGSCMNGSCHAVLGSHNHKLHIHLETQTEPPEPFCGLSRVAKNGRLFRFESAVTRTSSYNSQTAKTPFPRDASLSSSVLTKPCQSDCGSCGSGFTNSNRQRHPAALAYVDRARPPSGSGLLGDNNPLIRKLTALGHRGAPRGPPSFS
jgi:hypothetical protein